MSEIVDDVIESHTDYHVYVKHGDEWIDMPGFTQDTEEAAREGAKVLVDLTKGVRLFKVTVVTGVRREELMIQ